MPRVISTRRQDDIHRNNAINNFVVTFRVRKMVVASYTPFGQASLFRATVGLYALITCPWVAQDATLNGKSLDSWKWK